MQRHRYIDKAIAVLLLAAASVAVFCGLGQTQARYANYFQWRAVYTPEKTELKSDYLAPEGQTVLLNDWSMESNATRMKGISLSTNAGTISGTLSCVSDHPAHIQVSLDRTQVVVDTAGVHVQLTMIPTATALALTEQVVVNMRVEFWALGEAEPSAWAEYRVKLLPAETQSEETQPTETELEETQPEETQPVPPALEMDSPDTFAWEELLVLRVTAPEQADTLVLNMDGGSFPERTRYIFNGKTFLLGDAMQIETAAQGGQAQTLLFDFSMLSKPQSGEVVLQAQTLYQQICTGIGEHAATTTRGAFAVDLTDVDPILTGSGELLIPLCEDTDGLTWRLEMLTETQSGVVYAESDEQYYLVVTINGETTGSGTQKIVKISNVSAKAPAGTYRLTLERVHGDQVLSSAQVQFFICY